MKVNILYGLNPIILQSIDDDKFNRNLEVTLDFFNQNILEEGKTLDGVIYDWKVNNIPSKSGDNTENVIEEKCVDYVLSVTGLCLEADSELVSEVIKYVYLKYEIYKQNLQKN